MSQKLGLYERKEELHQKIEDFNERSFHFLNLHADIEASVFSQEDEDKDLDDEEDSLKEQSEDVADMQNQVITLLLPSNISTAENQSEMEKAKLIEMDLRKGQIRCSERLIN